MYTHTDNFRERLIVDTSIKFITIHKIIIEILEKKYLESIRNH